MCNLYRLEKNPDSIRRLFASILASDVPGVLQAVEQQDALGVEPSALLRGLLEVVHGSSVSLTAKGQQRAATLEPPIAGS